MAIKKIGRASIIALGSGFVVTVEGDAPAPAAVAMLRRMQFDGLGGPTISGMGKLDLKILKNALKRVFFVGDLNLDRAAELLAKSKKVPVALKTLHIMEVG